jgi:hypothetical protein
MEVISLILSPAQADLMRSMLEITVYSSLRVLIIAINLALPIEI